MSGRRSKVQNVGSCLFRPPSGRQSLEILSGVERLGKCSVDNRCWSEKQTPPADGASVVGTSPVPTRVSVARFCALGAERHSLKWTFSLDSYRVWRENLRGR